MQSIDALARTLAGLVKKEKTHGYDTTATVVKVEGGVAWIHIPGGVAQTPVEKTIDCSTGDRVTVRVADGRAWITGNATSPPTDDAAAKKAQSTASKAEKTAKDALRVKQHFWYDDAGAHVTEAEEVDFIKKPRGGNALLTSDGLYIKDGEDEVASFLGRKITMRNARSIPVFEIGSAGSTGYMVVVQEGAGELSYPPMWGDSGTVEIQVVWTDGEDHDYEWEEISEPSSATTEITVFPESEHEGTLIFTKDGGTYSVAVNGEGLYIGRVIYRTEAPLPYFTLGSRVGEIGPYSATIGENLIAPDPGLVIGKYNEIQGYPVSFAVGGGTADDDRRNIFEVSADGFVRCDTLYAGEAEIGDQTLGYVGETEIDPDDVTVTTGTFVDGIEYSWGPVRTVRVRVRKASSTAAGSNIFEGTLSSIDPPPVFISSGSYYGKYAIGASLGTGGNLIVRNASPDNLGAMGSSSTITVTFTYIQDN